MVEQPLVHYMCNITMILRGYCVNKSLSSTVHSKPLRQFTASLVQLTATLFWDASQRIWLNTVQPPAQRRSSDEKRLFTTASRSQLILCACVTARP